MKVYKLCDYFSEEILQEFKQTVYNTKWYSNVPGGFITNSPKRKVVAYGNGSSINSSGEFSTPGMENSYWTAGINCSNCTLTTKPLALPDIFVKMVPQLRKIFLCAYPQAIITENTFSIAVCNYYSQPDMYIAAHTDGQDWYPTDTDDGAIFASLTLYPDGEPENDSYARFQMKPKDKWESVTLYHESILIMSSNVLHRVMPHLKSHEKYFKPRINITFRSIATRHQDPLLHAMGVSNHMRYYGIPCSITFPEDCLDSVKEKLLSAYNIFATSHNFPEIAVICSKNKKTRTEMRQKLIKQCRERNLITTRLNNNIVLELLDYIYDC
jgi:hypothetical protein